MSFPIISISLLLLSSVSTAPFDYADSKSLICDHDRNSDAPSEFPRCNLQHHPPKRILPVVDVRLQDRTERPALRKEELPSVPGQIYDSVDLQRERRLQPQPSQSEENPSWPIRFSVDRQELQTNRTECASVCRGLKANLPDKNPERRLEQTVPTESGFTFIAPSDRQGRQAMMIQHKCGCQSRQERSTLKQPSQLEEDHHETVKKVPEPVHDTASFNQGPIFIQSELTEIDLSKTASKPSQDRQERQLQATRACNCKHNVTNPIFQHMDVQKERRLQEPGCRCRNAYRKQRLPLQGLRQGREFESSYSRLRKNRQENRDTYNDEDESNSTVESKSVGIFPSAAVDSRSKESASGDTATTVVQRVMEVLQPELAAAETKLRSDVDLPNSNEPTNNFPTDDRMRSSSSQTSKSSQTSQPGPISITIKSKPEDLATVASGDILPQEKQKLEVNVESKASTLDLDASETGQVEKKYLALPAIDGNRCPPGWQSSSGKCWYVLKWKKNFAWNLPLSAEPKPDGHVKGITDWIKMLLNTNYYGNSKW